MNLEKKKVLLHICCAPDATIPWPALAEEGYDVTGYFYGHNIHPVEEYIQRRVAVERLASLLFCPVVIEEYNPEEWFRKGALLAHEPEGGYRCALCFTLQLLGAAQAALQNKCSFLCTTLTISPHKDPIRINNIGEGVARRYGLTWLHRVWRKNNGFVRSVQASRAMRLYRQSYCGCLYSLRKEGR
ncbi:MULTISPECIES: epoxyqueuosine reductase QueH [Aminobacterium]|jgi:hypothetical protein|uniref:epoxyqueuosine reductase QueH n=1 Tax=Aminobacterium TaxID=81466 RepID=UPI00257F5519|nr:epoxyqueuosine reductase QueH [Aminobacterium sp. UBA4834]